MKQEKHQGKDRLPTHGFSAPGNKPEKDRFCPPLKTGVIVENPVSFPAEAEKKGDADDKPPEKYNKGDPECRPREKIVHNDQLPSSI